MNAPNVVSLAWVVIGNGLRPLHANGPAVARLADAAGKRPDDLAAVWLSNAPASVLPVLMFVDGSMVSMEGEHR